MHINTDNYCFAVVICIFIYLFTWEYRSYFAIRICNVKKKFMDKWLQHFHIIFALQFRKITPENIFLYVIENISHYVYKVWQ